MVEIIPAINSETQEDYERKLKLIEPYTDWIQVDIEDGIFAPRKTIRSDVVGFYETRLKIEVQLLVADVESWVEDFLAIGVDRIVFPIETAKDAVSTIKKIKENAVQVSVSLNPDTPLNKAESILHLLDTVLIMTVYPGPSGQDFVGSGLSNIKKIRNLYPKLPIEVDGHITPKTAKIVVEAGADILISGSYIFDSSNISKAIKNLKEVTF